MKTNNGFSLVEILIAAAILGGLSIAAMQLMKSQSKSASKANWDSETLLITNEINGILSDPTVCQATFATVISPSHINGKYKTKAGGGPSSGYGSAGIEIDSYNLTGTAPDGLLTIRFINKNILKGTSGAATVPKTVRLHITGAPGAITACRSSSTGYSESWKKGSGANISDIYYSAGNVGIGTATPVTKLDVSGTIRTAAATVAAACSPLGAQAHDPATGAPLYCSNTGDWKPVGGGAWPTGSYCIFRAGGSCPTGFTAYSGHMAAISLFAANSTYITPVTFGDSQISCHGYCGQYGNWAGELWLKVCCK